METQNGIVSPAAEQTDPSTAICILCLKPSRLHKLMRPLLYSMKAVGLYHFKRFYQDDSHAKPEEETGMILKHKYKLREITPTMVYSFLVCVVLVLNTARMISGFYNREPFELSHFLFTLMLVAWMLNCTTNAIACFRASHRYDALTEFFLEYEKTNTNRCLGNCKRVIWMYTILSWILVLLNTGATAYLLFMTSQLDVIISPVAEDVSYTLYAKIIYMIIHFYLSCAWIFPTAFMFFICSILFEEFRAFCKSLKSHILSNNNMLPPNFQELRLRHISLCKLVADADDFLSIYNGFTLGMCCIQITINLYNLIWYKELSEDPTVFVIVFIWTVASILIITVICVGAASVNGKAHESLDHIFPITYTNLSQNEAFQVQLFISKLSGHPIGLTAMKMFVVDKPTILTILGLLVTYFVIIVQFSPVYTDAYTQKQDCNCNDFVYNATLQCRTI